ncbi:MAG: hypothetical protein M3R13_01945 [Armatimonadota bacterium]|nr:hypothetical protein [Armatimonadota bacterium]
MRLATLFLALAPIVAAAQPLIPSKVSLEAQALNSRYIVVGTIVRLQKPASGDLTVGAVIKIEESLKGVGVGEEMEFHVYDQLKDVEKWRDGKARLMVFHDRPTIVLSDPALEVWSSAAVLGAEFSTMLHTGFIGPSTSLRSGRDDGGAVRCGDIGPSTSLRFGRDDGRAVRFGLRDEGALGFGGGGGTAFRFGLRDGQGGADGVLRRAEDVIELVKRTVAAYPGVFRMETFNDLVVPGREDQMRVVVPANAALERWALRTLPISADQHRRAEAAMALGYFRSEANIATLRALLKDEGTVRSTRDGKDVDLYLVRIRAWESLEMLGVRAPRPVEFRGGF